MAITRSCNKCGEEKLLEEFGLNKYGKMGRRSQCRACVNALTRERYANDPEPAKRCSDNWAKNNKGHKNAIAAKRRAAKLQRTPAWNDELVMQMIYEDCPEGHHVDHIVPLQGETVSGLHVHYNLQWLPAAENISKGNSWL